MPAYYILVCPPCTLLSNVYAEWAPAGPTVRTGRSSKRTPHSRKKETARKQKPARGERTGVRMSARGTVAIKPAQNLLKKEAEAEERETKMSSRQEELAQTEARTTLQSCPPIWREALFGEMANERSAPNRHAKKRRASR